MMKKKINLDDQSLWQDIDWDEAEVPEALKKTDAQVNRARANRLKANNPAFKEKLSKTHTGLQSGSKNPMYGKVHTEKTKQKLSEDRKGDKHWFYGEKRPDHAKALQGKPSGKSGKPSSNITKSKISKAISGENNPMYGKKHSEETLNKLREKLICPHCGQQGGKSNMKRWHFDNCKHK